jgi:hypothetical protein
VSIIYELSRKPSKVIVKHVRVPILHTKAEDLLTANVFGCLKYLNWRYALKPFLEITINQSISESEFEAPEFYFWNHTPKLREGEGSTEVDLIIKLKNTLFFVEAKYGSDTSSGTTNENDRDQLKRNLELGREYRKCLGLDHFHLLFITPSRTEPDFAHKYRGELDFSWTSWGAVAIILLENIGNYTNSEKRLATDVIDYLAYKEFHDHPYSLPESRMKINEKIKYESTLSRLTNDEKTSLEKIMEHHNLDLLRGTHFFYWGKGFSFRTRNPKRTIFQFYQTSKFRPRDPSIAHLTSLDEYLEFIRKER